MRSIPFLLILTAILSAQDGRGTDKTLGRGATEAKLLVPTVRAPAANDRIVIQVDTNTLKAAIVTPDGRRIDSANADANGFDWSQSPNPAPFGSADGGYNTVVFFREAGVQGNYSVELSSPPLPKEARVGAWFVSQRDEYDRLFQQLPGAQRLGPVSLDSNRRIVDLSWTLGTDEGGTLIDIAIAEPSATVSLKLPDGRVLTPQTPKTGDMEWKTVASRDEVDPPGSILGISGFLLPREGPHHVIALPKPAAGEYRIHVETSGANPTEVDAIVLPIERFFNDASDQLTQAPKVPEGAVILQPVALPYNAYVGDKLDLAVGLVGAVTGPVRFQVKVETRTPLPYPGNGPQEYAPPKVVTTPVTFTRGADGQYRGVLVPKERGAMRVSIQASGTNAAGRPFTDEVVLPQVMLAPVVATFVSLTERAVDDDGNGRPDRLEVTATLDVVTAGEYELRFDLTGAEGQSTGGEAKATLAAGRRKLTGFVPADKIFERLKDGPYRIANVQILRVEGNYSGESVKGPIAPLATVAYKRDQWDRGKVFGDEKVALRPVRPGKSGKFTAVEVSWEAVTQGGDCSWYGDLSFDNRANHLIEGGEYPKGPYRFTFEFDAAGMSQAKGEGHFEGIVNCGTGDGGSASASVPVTFDPSQFEPKDSAMRVFSQSMIRAVIGAGFGFSLADLEVEGKPSGTGIVYQLINIPGGLTPVLQGSTLQVSASNDIAPGRYYIEVEAIEGNSKRTGEVIVDVVPALPVVLRKYAVSAPKVQGIRADKDGKFQSLEVLWPVEVPADYCNWNGSIRLDEPMLPGVARYGAGVSGSGLMAAGKATLSLVFDGSFIGNAVKSNWIFQGHIGCDNHGREPGASIETKLTLQPSAFVKRPGLELTSSTHVRTSPGSQGIAVLYVKTDATDPAVFEFVNLPAGFQPRREETGKPGGTTAIFMVAADETVKPGRYYLPVKVTVGANQGTSEVVIDVVPER